ncbi:MAG: YcxB family protein [Verrucomicrobiota bacterium]
MSEAAEINVTSRITAEELIVGRKWHIRPWRMFRIFVYILGALMMGYGAYNLVLGYIEEAFIFIAVIGFAVSIRFPLHAWFFKRTVRLMPEHGGEIRWTFGEERVLGEADNSNFECQWPALFGSATTPEGFLLYPQKNLFYWIPYTAFSSNEEVEKLAQLLEAKTENKRIS